MIYVDEAMVKVDGNGVVWVTRREGEAYLEEYMRAMMKGQVGGLMLLAGIWYGGRTELVFFRHQRVRREEEGSDHGHLP